MKQPAHRLPPLLTNSETIVGTRLHRQAAPSLAHDLRFLPPTSCLSGSKNLSGRCLVLSKSFSGEPLVIPFANRRQAGEKLAAKLTKYADRQDVLVLGLPRGGVPVAYEVAHALHAPLDVFVVRKVGVPGHEELAMGAIASGDVRVVNEQVVRMLNIPDAAVDRVTSLERQELARRERLYR